MEVIAMPRTAKGKPDFERYQWFTLDPGTESKCDRCGRKMQRGLADLKDGFHICIACVDRITEAIDKAVTELMSKEQ